MSYWLCLGLIILATIAYTCYKLYKKKLKEKTNNRNGSINLGLGLSLAFMERNEENIAYYKKRLISGEFSGEDAEAVKSFIEGRRSRSLDI